MKRHYLTLGSKRLAVDLYGDPSHPAVLLLHGFPSSARTFRSLAPALAKDRFVIAPDLPGFGESDVLPAMTFAAMGEVVIEALERLSVGPRTIYLHDFGAPVGFHVALHAPDLVTGLIVQNANAHDSGMGPEWADTKAFWADPNLATERAATSHLSEEGIRYQYLGGLPDDQAALIDPAVWEEDWRVMTLPGRLEAQRALVKDYGIYARHFGELQAYLKARQPPAILLWGRHDPFFALAETLSWMEDLPRMEAHVLDAGHFLLETQGERASGLIRDFLSRQSAR